MDSQYRIIETTDKGEIWEATCPADPTIKPRRLKEKKNDKSGLDSTVPETKSRDSISPTSEQRPK